MPPAGAEVGLLDAAPAAYMLTDLEGRIRTTNERLRSWLGGGRDVESTAIRDHLTPASCLYYETVMAPTLSLQGEVTDVALELEVSGEVRHTLWAVRRVDNSEVIWVGIDVTDRRLHERELIAVQRRLARLQRLSSELLDANTAEAIGEILLGHLVDGVKADRGLVAIERGEGRLETVARHSLGSVSPPTAQPGEHPLVVESLERSSPVFTTVEAGEGYSHEDVITQVAVIPLMSERAVGVVWLLLGRAVPYSAEEKELLIAATDITSSSIGRALLHQRLEDDARRNASLSRLLHAMEAETSVRARAQRMADFLVPEHGEMAVVDLDEVTPDLAGVRHIDQSSEATVRWLHQRLGGASDAATIRPRLASGERLHATRADVTDAALDAAGLDPDEAAAVRALQLSSFVRIPLVARGRQIGTLTIASSAPGDDSDEVAEFQGRLADACALSLDNARIYEHEHEIAQHLQAALLPEHLPVDRRFSLHHFYQAGRDAVQVGGDWYDAFLLDGDRLGVMVGDVVGGGVTAARAMGKLRTVAHAFAQERRGVAGTLAGLHRFAVDAGEAFASSVMYGEVDLATGTIEYGSAGHLPPVLVVSGSEPALLAGGRGELLGLRGDREPDVATAAIPPGASIVMYTDGLIERPGRSIDVSIGELLHVLGHDPALAFQPEVLARKFDSDERRDDTCVLTLRLIGQPAPGREGDPG